jgi:twitching motility protein PilJ
MPVLGLLTLACLGAALYLLYAGQGGGVTGTSGSNAAQAAVARAHLALAGDADSFEELSRARTRLDAAAAANPGQARTLGQLSAVLGTIADNREALLGVDRSAEDLEILSSELTDRVYALESAITLQSRPAVAAQLERLRLLGDGVRRDLASLALGGDPNSLTQPLLDAEMGLGQVVRGFRDGDPELGLQPITESGATEALSAVERTSDAIADTIRNVVASSEQLVAVNSARAQLDQLALQLDTSGGGTSASAGGGDDLLGNLPLALTGVALLLFLVQAMLYLRSAGLRRTAALQAEQTDKNQAAIMRLLDEISSLADGDLTVKATVTEDITGNIADSINFAIEALRDLVATVNESAIMVDGAARQTDMTAQQLAEASASQSKQITLASDAIASMAATIEEVSGNAERSSDVARHSVDVAHKGGAAVRRTIEGMNTIRETIQETSKRIKRLGESSQEIGNIVELINDIADQTNILALNASIQASMAGEAGRGFAVVADEVQRLAERSTNATRQIEVLVRTIQADTNEAVVSMERSTTDVVGGALLAENAGAALEEIEQVSNQIASLVQNISDSARDQAGAAEGVTKNMGALQKINTQTAASTSETTDSISKLAALAAQLRESVAGFRLPEAAEQLPDDEARAEEFETASESGVGSDDAAPDDGDIAYVDQRTA